MNVFIRAIILIILFVIFASRLTFADDYVRITGSQFTYEGNVVKLKGANYYPKDHMWQNMWNFGIWPQIVNEVTMMRNLGLNCVRILVPYTAGGWGGSNPADDRVQMLVDLVNLFGQNGIRSCVTLFDWEVSFPSASDPKSNDHIRYINKIVGALKNNKYVLMWDVKNEPDHPDNIDGYDDWDYSPTKKAKIIDWIKRMATAIYNVDKNHPIGVGIRWYNNVSDVISYKDLHVAMFHSYWRGNIGTVQIPVVKAATSKPIVVEEFGWPTNPIPCYRNPYWIWDYTETEQIANYADTFAAFVQHNTAGGIQWMAFDNYPYTVDPYHTFEDYFGLWKYDYSLKPGGVYYRDNYPVTQFPTSPDTIAPKPVMNLTATALDCAVRLSWTTPYNWDFKSTMVRFSTTTFPAGPTDGTLVCIIDSKPYQSASVIHAGLVNGKTYYYSVFAIDQAQNYSTKATTSATPVASPPGQNISSLKTLPNNTMVTLNQKVVSAVFNDAVYVQEPDRSSGIRVTTTCPNLEPGDRVNIIGTLGTRQVSGVNSERQISATTFYEVSAQPEPPDPISLTCRNVGGGSICSLAPGVKDGYGLNNIGMLVRIIGKVTQKLSNYIYVDDGSQIQDIYDSQLGTYRTGVLVKCPDSYIPAQVGDYVSLTGIVEGSVPNGWTLNRRMIRIRNYSDLTVIP